MTFESAFFDKDLHTLALERACLNALEIGNVSTALRLIDRRCRIKPLADAHHFVLRAEMIIKNGLNRSLALADIRRALAIDPDHIAANRRLLAWGPPADKLAAATALLKTDTDVGSLEKVVECLAGSRQRVISSLREEEGIVSGFVLWRDRDKVEIVVEGKGEPVRAELLHNPEHPLAGLVGDATHVAIRLPVDGPRATVSLVADGDLIESFRVGRQFSEPPKLRDPDQPPSSRITIIIPVYKDLEATRICIESVFAECERNDNLRVIVVDDATPDAQVKAYLDILPPRPFLELLRNKENLGFVGAVNRALLATAEGDILLLNADAILPPGSVGRLSRIAHSSADIGTVTPMSNNGEYTSFPVPNGPNDLPPDEQLRVLDRAAEQANAGVVIDIPNGIGFCLYVKSACLAKIGPLPEHYGKGYLEDEDWCLSARENGFRNVCATSVFVGHAGSKSFGPEKRRLVVRNQKVLAARYPKAREQTAAFLAADSLRPARAALELALPASSTRAHLLVFGQEHLRPVVRRYASDLREEGHNPLLLECGGERPNLVRLRHPQGGIPQAIEFDLADVAELRRFEKYLGDLKLARVEIMDPRVVDAPLLKAIAGLGCPFDIFIADAGIISPAGADLEFKAWSWRATPGKSGYSHGDLLKWQELWKAYGRGAAKIIAPCQDAESFAKGVFPTKPITLAKLRAQPVRIPEAVWDMHGDSVALVALAPNALPENHVAKIARAVSDKWPVKTLLAIGKFANALELMRRENLIVIEADETDIADILAIHRINCMIFCDTQPIFGHPFADAAVEHGLAIALDLPLPLLGSFKTLALPLPVVG